MDAIGQFNVSTTGGGYKFFPLKDENDRDLIMEYGGEQTLESLMTLAPKWMAFLPALPFYFVELLVGFVQALVFTLLVSVYIGLICNHDSEEHGH